MEETENGRRSIIGVLCGEVKRQLQLTLLSLPTTIIFCFLLGVYSVLFFSIEALFVGTTHVEPIFKSTNASGVCETNGVDFKGIDEIFSAILSALNMDGGLVLHMMPRHPKVRWRFLFLLIGYPLSWGPRIFRTLNGEHFYFWYLFYLVALCWWLPDVIRKFSWRKKKRWVLFAIKSLPIAIVASGTGSMTALFVIASIDPSFSVWFLLVMIGIVYPLTSMCFRLILRGLMGKVVARSSGSRSSTTTLTMFFNQGLVAHFVIPGLFTAFLLEDELAFLGTLALQMLVEPISAWLFTFTLKSNPCFSLLDKELVRSNSRLVHARNSILGKPTSLPPLKVRQNKPALNLNVLAVFIASEQLGEKIAVNIASILSFIVQKDLSMFLWRYLISMLAETLADVAKVLVYSMNGIKMNEKALISSQSAWNYFASAIFLLGSSFTIFCGLFISCAGHI